ncbi:cell division protein FtsQ/DivIB [Virgibacillus sp. YIM 98842]|uniref:cell division protein FtsQ/DivIB n=1 Tax=Virgibacillus sp. YIM 98842 TaxID=2663533 RepID=UPI0013DA0602|nr:cell division protein FtsQ/DivIB [Virgibacillus sp. YIM 98842]
MDDKKIVSIEDRIPKLKQARKKKANRRLVFYLSIFFFLISIIVYLQSPLSYIKTIEVTGNTFLTDEEVIEISELQTNTNIWTINKEEIAEQMKDNPIVESAEVNRILPRTVEISLKEFEHVGYVEEENSYSPILRNGNILESMNQSNPNGDAPILIGFTETEYLERLANELAELPDSISNLISEIHWSPAEENRDKLLLYMNDGFLVDGTIRNFAEKMEVYPSIAGQLDEEEKGIIHIGVGAYFESFNEPPNEDDAVNEDSGSDSNEDTDNE